MFFFFLLIYLAVQTLIIILSILVFLLYYLFIIENINISMMSISIIYNNIKGILGLLIISHEWYISNFIRRLQKHKVFIPSLSLIFVIYVSWLFDNDWKNTLLVDTPAWFCIKFKIEHPFRIYKRIQINISETSFFLTNSSIFIFLNFDKFTHQ